MEISNKTLLESVGALRQLSDLSLPIKLSFKIAKIIRVSQPFVDAYEEVLKKLQDEYVAKDDEGNPRINDTDDPSIKQLILSDANAFNSAYEELLDASNKLEIEKLKLDEFGGVELKPSLLVQLSWLIEGLE